MTSSSSVQLTLTRCLVVSVLAALVTTTIIWVSHSTALPVDHLEEFEDYNECPESQHTVDHNSSTDPDRSDPVSADSVQSDSASVQTNKYVAAVIKAQVEAISILESTSGWDKTSGDKADGKGVVYEKSTHKWGNVFKLEGTININAEKLYTDMINELKGVPSWNPSVLESHRLERVDNSTDIAYNLAASGGSIFLPVSSRDFVFARHWEKSDGWYIISSVSVSYPPAPPKAKYVRGIQNPTVMRMKEITPNKCLLEWLLNIDLKGSLPTFAVDSALSGTMIDYLKDLRGHAAKL